MNNYTKIFFTILAATLLFACNHDNNPNKEKLAGKWYYSDFPQSYIEIEGTTYTEYLGEMNSKVVYTMHWQDSMHYQLEVKQVEGAAGTMYKPGDTIDVEVKEVTPDYYRFFAKGYCIIVLRQRDYKGPTGVPC